MDPTQQATTRQPGGNPVVLITGSGRRLGRHLALGFAGRGWDVAVHYGSSRDQAEQTLRDVQAMGVRGILVSADVSSRDSIQEAIGQAHAFLGRLDVLVNNAATYPAATPLEDVGEELWNQVMQTNLSGYFFAAQAAAAIMKGQKDGGRIINLASLGAYQIWKDRIPYHVSKAGVVQLTRALARSVAPGITVNAVAPGAIAAGGDPEADSGLIDTSRIPMQRHGTPDDIFRAVWFFAAEASYITGQTLLVDGGLSLR